MNGPSLPPETINGPQRMVHHLLKQTMVLNEWSIITSWNKQWASMNGPSLPETINGPQRMVHHHLLKQTMVLNEWPIITSWNKQWSSMNGPSLPPETYVIMLQMVLSEWSIITSWNHFMYTCVSQMVLKVWSTFLTLNHRKHAMQVGVLFWKSLHWLRWHSDMLICGFDRKWRLLICSSVFVSK